VWVANSASQLFQWNGSGWQTMPGEARFSSLPPFSILPYLFLGGAKQVAVNNKFDVWAVNNGQEIWHWNGAF